MEFSVPVKRTRPEEEAYKADVSQARKSMLAAVMARKRRKEKEDEE